MRILCAIVLFFTAIAGTGTFIAIASALDKDAAAIYRLQRELLEMRLQRHMEPGERNLPFLDQKNQRGWNI